MIGGIVLPPPKSMYDIDDFTASLTQNSNTTYSVPGQRRPYRDEGARRQDIHDSRYLVGSWLVEIVEIVEMVPLIVTLELLMICS